MPLRMSKVDSKQLRQQAVVEGPNPDHVLLALAGKHAVCDSVHLVLWLFNSIKQLLHMLLTELTNAW